MSRTVDQVAEILRQSKTPKAAMAKIQERVPGATAADIAEAVGIVGGITIDAASLREPPMRFAKPVQRRCEGCRQVFPARSSDELRCTTCVGRAAA